MKITLVFQPEHRIVNEPTLRETISNFGLMPSVSLLYVAAVCEMLGHEVQFIDVTAMGLSVDDVKRKVIAFQPDLIGMTVYTSHFHWAKEWLGLLQRCSPKSKLMVGGVHCTLFPFQTLELLPMVDYAVVGESEVVLPGLLSSIKNKTEPAGLAGIVYRHEDKIIFHGHAEPCEDLDTVPFPARHLIPNEKYFNFISRRRNFTVFNTSRGCPFHCIFCEAGGQKWRARSANNVVDEMEHCLTEHNIHEVDVFDSSFTINKQRVMDICKEIVNRGLQKELIWVVRSRVDTVDDEMLVSLKQAGCYRIFYGIESGDREVLKKLRKSANLNRMEKIVRLTNKIGISAFGYLLMGSPGETFTTARRTLEFAKKLPFDFVIFNRLTSFPGTELYKKYYLGLGMPDFWPGYLSSPEPTEKYLGRPWTKLSDQEVDQLTMNYMIQFYLRPMQLWRAIKNVRSLDQLKRYIKAGIEMLGGYLNKFTLK